MFVPLKGVLWWGGRWIPGREGMMGGSRTVWWHAVIEVELVKVGEEAVGVVVEVVVLVEAGGMSTAHSAVPTINVRSRRSRR